MLEKLFKRNNNENLPTQIKEEPFTFQIQENSVPHWGRELQREIRNLRTRMESNESENHENDDGSEVVVSQSNLPRKRKFSQMKKCNICYKNGHIDKECFKRTCQKCNGYGHDAEACPSGKRFHQSPAPQRNSHPIKNYR